MRLNVRLLNWSAGVPVAMMHPKTAEIMGVHESNRVLIKKSANDDDKFSTVVNLTNKFVKRGELGVSSEIKDLFNLNDNQEVEVSLTKSPISLDYIRKKIDKKKLSKKEIKCIIKDIVNNSLSDPEVALFVSGMYENKMQFSETIDLIESFLDSGERLTFDGRYVVDKHCIGGIPGNRTTPIVVAICAAAGLTFPKTSSKAITSAAGTADVIGAIAKIEFPVNELKRIVKETGACMVWGGSIELVPADSKIIRIEKMLKIDPKVQLLASIMSKKLAVGSKYILIDIPYGKYAKVNKKKALDLKKEFERLGNHFKLNLKVVLTDGSQPIGNGVGPLLELRDIMKILNPLEEGPQDLEKKSLFLAGQILEMTHKAKRGNGVKMAKEILYSGKAFEKFISIIKAQKGSIKHLGLGRFKKTIFANSSGKISEMNNIKINLLARIAGCPSDKSSGLYLYYKLGDKVKKGDKLMTIYSESKPRLNDAIAYYIKEKPIKFAK